MTASQQVDPDESSLTRLGDLGRRGWALPVVIWLCVSLLTLAVIPQVDRLYRRDGGALRASQLYPYGVPAWQSTTPDTKAARAADAARLKVEERWRARLVPRVESLASGGWTEADGRAFVLVVALVEDPAAFVRDADGQARKGRPVRAWAEGEHAAVALVGLGDVEGVLDERQRSVHSAVEMHRSAALVISAVVPPLALLVGFALLFIAVLLALLPVLAPWAWFYARRLARRQQRRLRSDLLPPGVEVAELDVRTVQRSGGGVLLYGAMLLSAVMLPVLTPALWPGSLFLAGFALCIAVLAMPWSRDSLVVRALLWLLSIGIVLYLVNAFLGAPAGSPSKARLCLGLALVAGFAAVLAVVRRRRLPADSTGIGRLGLRWMASWLGFGALVSVSIGLFLGSNSDTDPTRHVASKTIAVLGLVAAEVSARRLRGARSLAVYDRARRQGRPAVLYLRSFVDDRLRVRSEWWTRPALERWLLWPSERFEDVLLRGFDAIGPTVAIGRPGTGQTDLGAARELVVGDDWLTPVRAAMDGAQLITVVLGTGEGLAIELATLRQRGCLDRVCVVVPPLPATEAAQRIAFGTDALQDWGFLQQDQLDARQQIVAFVGIGPHRYVLTCRRRARAATYGALTSWVSGELAAHLATTYTDSGRAAEGVHLAVTALSAPHRVHTPKMGADIRLLKKQRRVLGDDAMRRVLHQRMGASQAAGWLGLLDQAGPDGRLPHESRSAK